MHWVFVTTGITSHINAYSRLARLIQDRGCRVTFVSPRAEGKELVEVRGFEFVLLADEAVHYRDHWTPIRPLAKVPVLSGLYRLPGIRQLMPYLNPFAHWQRAREHFAFITQNTEFDECLKSLAPDQVLVASELHAHIIRSVCSAYSTIVLETHVSTRRVPGVPILNSTLVPGRRGVDEQACDNTWRKALRERRWRRAVRRLFLLGKDEDRAIRSLALHKGFDFDRHPNFSGHWHFYTFTGLTHWHLCAREFDFPYRDDGRHFLGPQVLRDREDAVLESDPDAAWAEPVKRAVQQQRPIILCAMGSFAAHQDKAFLRKVIQAATQNPDWLLLLVTGNDIGADDLAVSCANVLLFPFLPLLDVLPHASVIIGHGGIATINESVINQVPMAIYSSGFLDRNGNAARVAFHNLGLVGDFHDASAQSISRDIGRLLTEPQFRDSLKDMAACYQSYARIAGQMVDEQLAHSQPR